MVEKVGRQPERSDMQFISSALQLEILHLLKSYWDIAMTCVQEASRMARQMIFINN
jgi:hypothetical protein